MANLEYVYAYLAGAPLAIEPGKLRMILAVLDARRGGQPLAYDEDDSAEPDDAAESLDLAPSGSVAEITIRGTLSEHPSAFERSSGGTSYARIRRGLQEATADPSIKTLLLNIDSPGGAVHGCSELAGEIYALRDRVRVVALANSQLASAAYWLASGASEIVATPGSTTVGSIGVVHLYQEHSERLEREGIRSHVFRTPENKAELTGLEPLPDDAAAAIRRTCASSYERFVADVAAHRGVSADVVRSGYGEGRAIPAADALAAGLVDRIATREELVAELLADAAREAAANPSPRAPGVARRGIRR